MGDYIICCFKKRLAWSRVCLPPIKPRAIVDVVSLFYRYEHRRTDDRHGWRWIWMDGAVRVVASGGGQPITTLNANNRAGGRARTSCSHSRPKYTVVVFMGERRTDCMRFVRACAVRAKKINIKSNRTERHVPYSNERSRTTNECMATICFPVLLLFVGTNQMLRKKDFFSSSMLLAPSSLMRLRACVCTGSRWRQ